MVIDRFEDYGQLADYMVDRIQDGLYVVAALDYYGASMLLKELMLYKDLHIDFLELSPPEFDGYEKEFYVSLCYDKYLSVEYAFRKGRYMDPEADLQLVGEDVSSAILSTLDINKTHEVRIGPDD